MVSPSPRIASLLIAVLMNSSLGYSAEAELKPVVAVVGFRTEEIPLERQARESIIRRLEKSDKVLLVPENVTAKNIDEIWSRGNAETANRLSKAQTDYLEGKKLYEQLSVDEAIVAFNEAVQGFREGIHEIRDNRYLLLAHLYLGMALVTRGRTSEGNVYIREMIVLDPLRDKRQLPVREYPPKIVKIHQTLTKEVINGPSGDVVVETEPAGANVYFDGVLQGPSPIKLSDVPVGQHFVLAERNGYMPYAQRLVVSPGKNVHKGKLKDWLPLAPYPFDKRKDFATNEFLGRVSQQLGADMLLLGYMTRGQGNEVTLTGQLYDVRSKEFTTIEKVETSRGAIAAGGDSLARRILNDLTVGGNIVAEISRPTDQPFIRTEELPKAPQLPKTEEPIYRKWWVWAIAGAVVAGGVGAFFLLRGSDPNFNVLSIDNPLN